MLRVVSAANPHGNWRAQFRLLKALQRAARTAPSRRKLGRILLSSELLNAGLVLAGQRADRANTLLDAQLGRRDGTMIAFLALIPIRLRSLSELELGRSVLVGETEICIVLTSEMTKNGRPWETTVPSALAPVLRRYIDDVRPWLMARSSQSHHSLWVGRMGEPLAYKTLSNLIPEATSRVLGVRVSPHLFRDAAATTLARTSPADTRLIRPLLAHSSDAIAERHYNHAQGIEAGRGLAALITKLTKEDA
jgi:integrase